MRFFWVVLLLAGCTEKAPPAVDQAPKTDGVEGHGGIAVAPIEPVQPRFDEAEVRDLYLRGYQLKDFDPKESVRLFREVIVRSPKTSEWHQKALKRIEELERSP